MQSFLRWALAGLYYFIYYVGCILLTGSVLFAVLFLALGLVFSPYTAKELLYKGLSVGFRYAGVWAGGTALVLTVKKIIEKNQSNTKLIQKNLD